MLFLFVLFCFVFGDFKATDLFEKCVSRRDVVPSVQQMPVTLSLN